MEKIVKNNKYDDDYKYELNEIEYLHKIIDNDSHIVMKNMNYEYIENDDKFKEDLDSDISFKETVFDIITNYENYEFIYSCIAYGLFIFITKNLNYDTSKSKFKSLNLITLDNLLSRNINFTKPEITINRSPSNYLKNKLTDEFILKTIYDNANDYLYYNWCGNNNPDKLNISIQKQYDNKNYNFTTCSKTFSIFVDETSDCCEYFSSIVTMCNIKDNIIIN